MIVMHLRVVLVGAVLAGTISLAWGQHDNNTPTFGPSKGPPKIPPPNQDWPSTVGALYAQQFAHNLATAPPPANGQGGSSVSPSALAAASGPLWWEGMGDVFRNIAFQNIVGRLTAGGLVTTTEDGVIISVASGQAVTLGDLFAWMNSGALVGGEGPLLMDMLALGETTE
jgi:hypothetical protein